MRFRRRPSSGSRRGELEKGPPFAAGFSFTNAQGGRGGIRLHYLSREQLSILCHGSGSASVLAPLGSAAGNSSPPLRADCTIPRGLNGVPARSSQGVLGSTDEPPLSRDRL